MAPAEPKRPPAIDSGRRRQVLLWLQFDGTELCGFQRQQAGIRTVASVLEEGWLRLLGETIIARPSSRTDSGVHARRMPVLVRTDATVPVRGLVLGLNTRLPEDVAVQAAEDVTPDFDVRADAMGKRYVYRLVVGEARQPLLRRTAWHVPGTLDLAAMREAAAHFAGIHDFAAFRAVGCVAKSTIRQLRSVEVAVESPCVVAITVDGNAFLMNMVRILAGTLVDVGRGRQRADAIPGILLSGDRKCAGQTAPAQGLTLDEVFYGPHGARHGLDFKAMLANMATARGDG